MNILLHESGSKTKALGDHSFSTCSFLALGLFSYPSLSHGPIPLWNSKDLFLFDAADRCIATATAALFAQKASRCSYLKKKVWLQELSPHFQELLAELSRPMEREVSTAPRGLGLLLCSCLQQLQAGDKFLSFLNSYEHLAARVWLKNESPWGPQFFYMFLFSTRVFKLPFFEPRPRFLCGTARICFFSTPPTGALQLQRLPCSPKKLPGAAI